MPQKGLELERLVRIPRASLLFLKLKGLNSSQRSKDLYVNSYKKIKTYAQNVCKFVGTKNISLRDYCKTILMEKYTMLEIRIKDTMISYAKTK